MMHIAYVPPPQSPEETKKAREQTMQMQRLVAELNSVTSDGRNRYTLLSQDNRTHLKALGFKPSLVDNLAFMTERVRLLQGDDFVERDQLMIGFTSNAFDSGLYGSDAIRDTLVETHRGRCAFCETLIAPTNYGDVEHFRPKAGYTSDSSVLYRPGYYDLAYEPQNLLYACQLCNGAYKQNAFPVIGERVPAVTLSAEQPLLLNPYVDDPRNYLRFNPMNARAYPFDLVCAFYAATQSWGVQQTQLKIWQDPTAIPDQKDFRGAPLTSPQVDQAFGTWLSSVRDPMLRRGLGTLRILNLNRPALLRARAAQLRQLRGLVCAASTAGPDQAAAQQAITAIAGGNASLSPQYVSLSVDALQTWSNQGGGSFAWMTTYNQMLDYFQPVEQAKAPMPHSDALVFLVLEGEEAIGGRRRMVYISNQDKVYGNPGGGRGLALAIDWDEALENTALISSAKGERTVSMFDFMTQLASSSAAWNTFRNAEVWVLGDYRPFATA